MAEGGENSFKVNVRYGSRESQEITVNRAWTARDLKQHVVEELDIESGAVDLIFTGQHISDDTKVTVSDWFMIKLKSQFSAITSRQTFKCV